MKELLKNMLSKRLSSENGPTTDRKRTDNGLITVMKESCSVSMHRFARVAAFVVLMLIAFCGNAWGGTWTGWVGVGSGKGTATVKVFKYPLGIKSEQDKKTNRTSTLQKATTSGASTTDGSIEYSASASDGYTFYGWFTTSACSGDPISQTGTDWVAYSRSKHLQK